MQEYVQCQAWTVMGVTEEQVGCKAWAMKGKVWAGKGTWWVWAATGTIEERGVRGIGSDKHDTVEPKIQTDTHSTRKAWSRDRKMSGTVFTSIHTRSSANANLWLGQQLGRNFAP